MAWDVTKPADTDLVRNFPAAYRTDKTTLQTDLQVEHDILPTAGSGTGRHKFPSGNTAGRPANPATGSIYFNTQTGLERFDGSAWVNRAGFAAGTKLIFPQATAPAGWTRVVDAANTDATIILRQNSEVPTVGGTWTIAGIGDHTLITANLPSHTHGMPLRALTGTDGGNIIVFDEGQGARTQTNQTDATGSATAVTHSSTGTWRPKHVDCVVATKD